jgi:hypothetical protein
MTINLVSEETLRARNAAREAKRKENDLRAKVVHDVAYDPAFAREMERQAKAARAREAETKRKEEWLSSQSYRVTQRFMMTIFMVVVYPVGMVIATLLMWHVAMLVVSAFVSDPYYEFRMEKLKSFCAEVWDTGYRLPLQSAPAS